MKKELITVDNLDTFICKQDGKLYVFGARLLTAGAKDECGRRRVSIVYGPEPASTKPVCGKNCGPCRGGCSIEPAPSFGGYSSLEELALTVAKRLKDHYGVTDPEELKRLTVKALKAIRENI